MEFVFVVKRYDLFDLAFPHGFVSKSEDPDGLARTLERTARRGFFLERRHAEVDSSFKQIIPYTLLIRGGREVLLLKRSAKGGDHRLHNKLSIGVGGHVNPEDAPGAGGGDLLAACARREMAEELEIGSTPSPEPVGVINDDSNPVGSVHFGIVHAARMDGGEAKVRETELLEASFASVDELKELAADPAVNLETWSRLIIERIDEFVARGP